MPPEGQTPAVRARGAELYARFSEELFGFIRSMLPVSKQDARDLLQQVFTEVLGWLSKNEGVPLEHPRGFLYALTRRRLIKHRDKLSRTPTSRADDAVDAIELSATAHADDMELLAAQGQDRRMLLRAMRRLGESSPVDELQVVVYLRFWAGMTEGQIGEVMGLKRGAVIRRLRRALGLLRTRLEEFEREQPSSTPTSTALLRCWWEQLEQEVGKELPRAGEPTSSR